MLSAAFTAQESGADALLLEERHAADRRLARARSTDRGDGEHSGGAVGSKKAS